MSQRCFASSKFWPYTGEVEVHWRMSQRMIKASISESDLGLQAKSKMFFLS